MEYDEWTSQWNVNVFLFPLKNKKWWYFEWLIVGKVFHVFKQIEIKCKMHGSSTEDTRRILKYTRIAQKLWQSQSHMVINLWTRNHGILLGSLYLSGFHKRLWTSPNTFSKRKLLSKAEHSVVIFWYIFKICFKLAPWLRFDTSLLRILLLIQ